MAKKEKKTVATEKTVETPLAERKPKRKIEKNEVKAFFKRFWYWFAVIPLLIGGALIWAWQAGMLDIGKKEECVLTTDGSRTIDTYIYGTYYFNVKSSGGQEVKYAVCDGYEKLVEFDGSVMRAVKLGQTRVKAYAGNAELEFFVSVSEYIFNWTVPVGYKIESDVFKRIKEEYLETVELEVTNGNECLEAKTDADGNEYYEAIKAGIATVCMYDSAGAGVCLVHINVKDDISEDEAIVNESVIPKIDFSEAKFGAVAERITGMTRHQYYEVPMPKFDLSGYLLYYSTDERVITVTSTGFIQAVSKGTACITIACVDEKNSRIAYYNVEIVTKADEYRFIVKEGDDVTVEFLEEQLSLVHDEVEFVPASKNVTGTKVKGKYARFTVEFGNYEEGKIYGLNKNGDVVSEFTFLKEYEFEEGAYNDEEQ